MASNIFYELSDDGIGGLSWDGLKGSNGDEGGQNGTTSGKDAFEYTHTVENNEIYTIPYVYL